MGLARSLFEALAPEVTERNEVDPALSSGTEEKGKPGAFKVSSKALHLMKQIPGFEAPDAALFTQVKKLVHDLSLAEIAKSFGEDDVAKAQDFVAKSPRQAFNKWLLHITRISPKLGKRIRTAPDNAALIFYTVVTRFSGRDMADLILKRYFETESDHPGTVKARMKVEELEEELEAATQDLQRRIGD